MNNPKLILPPNATHLIGRRAAGVIVDSIILSLLYLAAWFGFVNSDLAGYVSSPHPVIILVVMLIVYHAAFEGGLGATPGKLITGLRVVDQSTLRKPGFAQALVRNLLRPVDVLLGYVVGALVASASTYRQRLGDHAAATLVVDTRFKKYIEEAEDTERRKRAGAQAEQRVSHELGKLAAFDGDYYVWDDLEEAGIGNIDHLVVGAGGMTIIETKSNRGVVHVEGDEPPTVDGRPLHRDVLKQIQNQRRAIVKRMGLGNTDPDEVAGFNWMICFARGELSSGLAPNVRRRLATTRDLRGKIRSQPRHATPEGVPEDGARHRGSVWPRTRPWPVRLQTSTAGRAGRRQLAAVRG